MNSCDSDFDDMDKRRGGPGAGLVVWLFVCVSVTILSLGVAKTLDVIHQYQHDHPTKESRQ